MNLTNLDRAQRTMENPEGASDRDLRHAIRYYRAYNGDVRRKAQIARESRSFYESEWGDSSWSDTTNAVLNERIAGNRTTLRALNAELKRRKLNRV